MGQSYSSEAGDAYVFDGKSIPALHVDSYKDNGNQNYNWTPISGITVDREEWKFMNPNHGDSKDSSARITMAKQQFDEDFNKVQPLIDNLGIDLTMEGGDGDSVTGRTLINELPEDINDNVKHYKVTFNDLDKLRAYCCAGQIKGAFCGEYGDMNGAMCKNRMEDICRNRYGLESHEDACDAYVVAHPESKLAKEVAEERTVIEDMTPPFEFNWLLIGSGIGIFVLLIVVFVILAFIKSRGGENNRGYPPGQFRGYDAFGRPIYA